MSGDTWKAMCQHAKGRRRKEERKTEKKEKKRKRGKGKRKRKECRTVSRPGRRRTQNCATRGRFPHTPVNLRLGAT